MCTRTCACLVFVYLVSVPRAQAQPFTDVTADLGLSDVNGEHGVAWGDYDGDGDVDLWVTGRDRLYPNNGDGTFAAGISLSVEGRSAHWADYDNDGDLDLLTTRGPRLYRNDEGAFVLANNTTIGLAGLSNLGDASWIDFDRDGWLDIWAPNGSNPGNYLFRNDGDGTFSTLGADHPVQGLVPSGNGEITAVADFNNDGYADIVYRNSGAFVWQANGDGSFSEVAAAVGIGYVDTAGGYNGLAFGDYDNDGWLDLYAAQPGSNRMFRNRGDGTFVDTTVATVTGGEAFTSRGVAFGDYDNDGDVDLFVANSDGANGLFRNDNGVFTEVAATLGLADAAASFGCGWADYDNDGDLDLFVASTGNASRLYRNDLNNANYVKVLVTGLGPGFSPRDGTGAQVRLFDASGSTVLATRELTGGEGYGSHSPRIAHFGLPAGHDGNAGQYGVSVRFSSGRTVGRLIIPMFEAATRGATTLAQTVDFREPQSTGAECSEFYQCESGFCVDGVCCDRKCNGGCEVCAAIKGASADGVCGPAPSDVVCRPAAGACDLAETCDGEGLRCPDDSMVAECCEQPEHCDDSDPCTVNDCVANRCTSEPAADCMVDAGRPSVTGDGGGCCMAQRDPPWAALTFGILFLVICGRRSPQPWRYFGRRGGPLP